MLRKLKLFLISKCSCHFVDVFSDDDDEIDLFIKSLRGVSGIKRIYWYRESHFVKVFVLGNTNKLELAMRELLPRFNIKISRVQPYEVYQ